MEEKFSKERIKAEMDEAKWNVYGAMILIGILGYFAVISSITQQWGIALLLWLIVLVLAYGAWIYNQRYKKWKSML